MSGTILVTLNKFISNHYHSSKKNSPQFIDEETQALVT